MLHPGLTLQFAVIPVRDLLSPKYLIQRGLIKNVVY